MSVIKSNLVLLLVAAIWGLGFVAQKAGMDYVGPFTYNGVRFILAVVSLLPLLFIFRDNDQTLLTGLKKTAWPGLLVGTVLFIATSFQQVGLVTTTAGKAAFITGLYLVLVPILGILLRHKVPWATWLGCLLAVAGLYFLCIRESMSIQYGDALELASAFFWACHILVIAHFSRKVNVVQLSWLQILTCAILSLITAVATEEIVVASLVAATVPIVYGGVFSVGIAYTLQILGQKHAPPAHAAIILSMETVFAAIGGFLLIQERMGGQEILGCALMLSGMLVSQLFSLRAAKGAVSIP